MNLWKIPAYLPYVKPSLTDVSLRALEKSIKNRLPASLVTLLSEQNGGYVRKLPQEPCPGGMIFGIGESWPCLSVIDEETTDDFESLNLEGLVPFDGDGHWHLCLDYQDGGDNPSVCYIDLEEISREKLSDSFDEFLSKLSLPDLSDTYFFESSDLLVDVISACESDLGLKFKMQGSISDNGFDVYAAQLESGRIWISQNEVSRAFYRAGSRYASEYESLLHEKSLRFPEIRKSCFIIKFSSTDNSKGVKLFTRKYALSRVSEFI